MVFCFYTKRPHVLLVLGTSIHLEFHIELFENLYNTHHN